MIVLCRINHLDTTRMKQITLLKQKVFLKNRDSNHDNSNYFLLFKNIYIILHGIHFNCYFMQTFFDCYSKYCDVSNLFYFIFNIIPK